jgi:hypothetical protein
VDVPDPPSFRAQQTAAFSFHVCSCKRVGLRREKSLFDLRDAFTRLQKTNFRYPPSLTELPLAEEEKRKRHEAWIILCVSARAKTAREHRILFRVYRM